MAVVVGATRYVKITAMTTFKDWDINQQLHSKKKKIFIN